MAAHEPMERVKLRDTITRTIQVCTDQRVGHKEAWLTACAIVDDLLAQPDLVAKAIGFGRMFDAVMNVPESAFVHLPTEDE